MRPSSFFLYSTLGILTLMTSLHAQTKTKNALPKIVATPPSDAGRGLVRVSKTEIRHYCGDKKNNIYLVSTDNGNTWREKQTPNSYPPNYGGVPKESPAIIQNPLTKEYIRVQPAGGFIFLSDGGLDGKWLAVTKDGKLEPNWKDEGKRKDLITLSGIMRNPLFVNKGKRILIPAHNMGEGTWCHISDDGGLTWKRSKDTISVPKLDVKPPDQGPRWYNAGLEASLVELDDGKIYALTRTSHNQHWESFSQDFGNTWSKAQPSRFFGTLTMPTVGKLKNGLLIALWTNTMSMPESPRVTKGTWEDVFTNRDSHHIALSSDNGKTWKGFREIILDEHRNNDNYATFNGPEDRGKHQSEFVELDNKRILISLGQHKEHRRLMIVELPWVYETSRANAFENGTDDWTIHTYIPKTKGHASYDRKPSATLIPNPHKSGAKALLIKRLDDPSLVKEEDAIDYQKGGATWNFPNGTAGQISFCVSPASKQNNSKEASGVQVSLTDRLFNACDDHTKDLALFSFEIVLSPKWGIKIEDKPFIPLPTTLNATELTIKWKDKQAALYVGKKFISNLPSLNNAPNGISYIHFISTAEKPDEGMVLESVWAQVK